MVTSPTHICVTRYKQDKRVFVRKDFNLLHRRPEIQIYILCCLQLFLQKKNDVEWIFVNTKRIRWMINICWSHGRHFCQYIMKRLFPIRGILDVNCAIRISTMTIMTWHKPGKYHASYSICIGKCSLFDLVIMRLLNKAMGIVQYTIYEIHHIVVMGGVPAC